MKTLNVTSTITLKKMISMLKDGYTKIDNTGGSFMPVSVEVIADNKKYFIVSVAHYFEQNGDLMADPEMCFIYLKALKTFLPSYFKQSGCFAIEQESVVMQEGIIVGIRTKMQAEHTEFANTCLRNIRLQQNL